MHHGGQESLQVLTVMPYQFSKGFSVLRQGWNNTDIRKC
jgi:hypothetical protein